MSEINYVNHHLKRNEIRPPKIRHSSILSCHIDEDDSLLAINSFKYTIINEINNFEVKHALIDFFFFKFLISLIIGKHHCYIMFHDLYASYYMLN